MSVHHALFEKNATGRTDTVGKRMIGRASSITTTHLLAWHEDAVGARRSMLLYNTHASFNALLAARPASEASSPGPPAFSKNRGAPSTSEPGA